MEKTPNLSKVKYAAIALALPLSLGSAPVALADGATVASELRLSPVQVTGARMINPTTVEVTFANGQHLTVDFYGDNIFRMFRDDQGGILRSPSATPPAQILADQPRAKSVNVQATTEGNAAVIQSGKNPRPGGARGPFVL